MIKGKKTIDMLKKLKEEGHKKYKHPKKRPDDTPIDEDELEEELRKPWKPGNSTT